MSAVLDQLARCRVSLQQGGTLIDTLTSISGFDTIADGFWRLFSSQYPSGGGVVGWNVVEVWKAAWGMSADSVASFGEDIFGNQLVVRTGSETAEFWDHESGEFSDLCVPPIDLLEAVASNRVSWADLYPEGAVEVARFRVASVPDTHHLHWITPLILGGVATPSNLTLVERRDHLVGHAELWRQVGSLEPGTVVIPRAPGSAR